MWKFLVFICILSQIRGEESPFKVQELVESLFKNYNSKARPNNENGKIGNVTFGLSPICLEYTQEKDLKGLVWYKMIWYDDRLKWDPENGIEFLSICNEMVWKPDIVPFFGEESIDTRMNVLIYPTGKVLFVPKVYLKYKCYDASADKPIDERICPLQIGSWTYSLDLMNLDFFEGKEDVNLRYYANAQCPVKLLHSKATRSIKKYSGYPKDYVSLTFHLNFLVQEEKNQMKLSSDYHPKKHFLYEF